MVSVRTLVRSRTVTRASARSVGWSWPWPDVDRVHVRRAPLEQAVGEAAGRRPGIESPAPGDGDGEEGEGRIELQAAAADEGRGRAEQHDRLVGRHEARRLLRDRSRDQYGTGGDRRLGLLPAREEAPSHELGIEPTAGPDAQLAAFLSDFLPEDFLSDVDSWSGTSWSRTFP